ncbi:hypothetical protein [Kitasatospora acidiphila]|nr:hypothetical protein [Kitasatospora acidiphila]
MSAIVENTEELETTVTEEEATAISDNVAAFFADGNVSMMGGWTN